jgi:hypothetical protein
VVARQVRAKRTSRLTPPVDTKLNGVTSLDACSATRSSEISEPFISCSPKAKVAVVSYRALLSHCKGIASIGMMMKTLHIVAHFQRYAPPSIIFLLPPPRHHHFIRCILSVLFRITGSRTCHERKKSALHGLIRLLVH